VACEPMSAEPGTRRRRTNSARRHRQRVASAAASDRETLRFVLSAAIPLTGALAFAGCVDMAGEGSGYHAVELPNPPGYCACPSCDCASKGDGGGPCHCSLDACNYPCNRFV
jgi:hypothetical protein